MPLFFDDLSKGIAWETPRRTVSEADVVNFAGLSGDFNPIHTDAVHAADTPFGQRIAHGALVFSMVTGLRQRGGQFDGTLIAFLEVRSWKFKRPVFIGDTIHARSTVAEMRETSRPERGIVVQKVEVFNQRGDTVQEGEFVTMLRRRQEA